jgi:hypothetical protein
MEKTFQLGNQTFTISVDIKDSLRREQYFKNPSSGATLTDEERRVLSSLGIDDEMETKLKDYLTVFFDEIPYCSDDARIRLSAACEVPYHVVWLTEFTNQEETKKRIQQQTDEGIVTRPLLNMAEDGEIIKGFQPVLDLKDEYDNLFTLAPASTGTTILTASKKVPVKHVVKDDYEKAFTLIAAK